MKTQLVFYLAEGLILASVLAAAEAPLPWLLAAALPLPCHLSLHACLVRAGLRRGLAVRAIPVPRLLPALEGVR